MYTNYFKNKWQKLDEEKKCFLFCWECSSVHLGNVGHPPVGGHVLDHVSLLPERPVADGADEGLFAGVDLEVLLEVEPLWVDQQAADGTALVLGPVVVHVEVEVLQIAEQHVALDAVQRPDLFLDLIFVSRDDCVLFSCDILLGRHWFVLRFLGGAVRLGRGSVVAVGLLAVVVVVKAGRGKRKLGKDGQGWGRGWVRVSDGASVVLLHSLDLLHQLDLLHGHLRPEEVWLLLPEVGHCERQAEVRQGRIETWAGVHVDVQVFGVVFKFTEKII